MGQRRRESMDKGPEPVFQTSEGFDERHLCEFTPMQTKEDIARNWLPRYTGTPVADFGDYVLITNWKGYVTRFAEWHDVPVMGEDRPMQTATNKNGLTIVNYGIGSPNAALVMDLLSARMPKGVLFLGKVGGLRKSTEIGHFILPIAAIRGEGTSNDYFPPEVPALPSFKLHKFVSDTVLRYQQEYRTGVVYTTNRRVWEWDEAFKQRLLDLSCLAIDMETATVFIVGHKNGIPRGALLLVSDIPVMPEGIKTEESDRAVTEQFVDLHLRIGIDAMTEIGQNGEEIKHLRF
jgi:AMP nucleosidase